MALTLVQLIEAAQRYVGKPDAHSVAALTKNLSLAHNRAAETVRHAASEATSGPLSSNANVAELQILEATGHPVQFGPNGETIALEPGAVLADCDPDQNRELALLGFFGHPGDHPGVDYSLFERYYVEAPAGLTEGGQPTEGNWAPKDPSTSPWAAWQAGE